MSMISVDYDVLNQRGSPAWFTDTFANIPTAGYVGRMFISTDTFAFYRDTGTGWDLIGGPGIGTLTGSGVTGQVSFFNGTQVLAGNNNLFWDNTNGRLGIGTATPSVSLEINGSVSATTLIKSGGTSSQFLKADGTIDSNTYLTTSAASSTYLPLAGGTLTGALIGTSITGTSLVKSGGTSAQILAADGTVITAGTNITISGGTIASSGGGSMAIGGSITSATAGSVLYAGASGVLAQTNASFYYDYTNNRLGLGTTTVGSKLQVNGNAAIGYSASTAAPTNGLAVSGQVNINTTTTSTYGKVFIKVATDENIVFRDSPGTARMETVNDAVTLFVPMEFTASRYSFTGGSGFVGINTTTPGSYLQVNGSAAIGYSASTAAPTNGLLVNGNVQLAATKSFTGTAASYFYFGYPSESTGPTFVMSSATRSGGPYYIGYDNDGGHRFANSTESAIWLTISSSGVVGIGTTTIGSTLQVNGNAAIGYSASTAAPTNGLAVSGTVLVGTTSENSFSSARSIQINGASGSLLETRYNGTSGLRVGSDSGHCYIHEPRNNEMRFATFDTVRMTISGAGVVTIANLAGTGSRTVLADANGALSAPVSDMSVKQNIQTIGYGLNEILKMNPVWFDYIDEYKNFGETRQNGNIAQEMEAIIPEAVFTTPSTGKMGINYDQLHAVYIKAIQELKTEIEILKNK